jgi:ABC-type multidrug transport system ATPase subunit
MRQRAKMAGALVHDPAVLVLDEPFNGMDPRQRLHMMDLLRDLAAAGRTIIFSSHILEEVERVAEQVLVVVAGRLAASGDFRAIRRLMTDRPTSSDADLERPGSRWPSRPRHEPASRLRRAARRAGDGLRGLHRGAGRDRAPAASPSSSGPRR